MQKLTIGVIGRSDRRIIQAAKMAQKQSESLEVKVYKPIIKFTAEPELRNKIIEEQILHKFSLYEAIACDRSFTDYTYGNCENVYSSLNSKEIESFAINNYFGLINFIQGVDFVVDGLHDNILTAISRMICTSYGKKMYQWRNWHILPNHTWIIDEDKNRLSIIRKIMQDPIKYGFDSSINWEERLRGSFGKAYGFEISIKEKIRLFLDKRKGYERGSLYKIIKRRVNKSLRRKSEVFGLYANIPSNEKYVVYCMHVAPEASILGTDPEISDQISVIKKLRLATPLGVGVYLKIHPGNKWHKDFPGQFINSIKSYAGIKIIHEGISISEVMNDKNCLLISTINGSVLIDSMLARVPALAFGVSIAEYSGYIDKYTSIHQLRKMICDIVEDGRESYLLERTKKINELSFAILNSAIKINDEKKYPKSWAEHFAEFIKKSQDLYARE